MSEDHLSNEVSVSAELTETGVTAAAKSRTLASVDRLVGSVFDTGSAWLEGIAERRRAKNAGERQLIEAAAKYGIDRMNTDDEFAKRAYEGMFKKAAKAQLNKEAVVAEALTDLREQPPTPEQAVSGPGEINELFMDRFERYAEGATTEELRHRWGRILASEIRQPGTFGPKVLRATDELDSDAASLFERVCLHQFRANAISKDLIGELPFDDRMTLVSAGLMADPGLSGHISLFVDGKFGGEPAWFFSIRSWAVGFRKSCDLDFSDSSILRSREDGIPAMQAYILTDVGIALSSILHFDEISVVKRLAPRLQESIKGGELLYFRMQPDARLLRVSPPV